MHIYALVLFATFLFGSNSRIVPVAEISKQEQEEYLKQFGYWDTLGLRSSVATDNEEKLKIALKSLQKYAGLEQNGILNKETESLMKSARCGMPDNILSNFESFGAWPTKNIAYKIKNYPKKTISLNPPQIENILSTSMNDWAKSSALTFSKSAGAANINIEFAGGDHGDNSPFDGPGKVLAHGFYPKDGRLHFDNDETWSNSPGNEGRFLRSIATHELGHVLGLPHSEDKTSVMYPYYKGYETDFKLGQEDIKNIRSLYGVKPVNGLRKFSRIMAAIFE